VTLHLGDCLDVLPTLADGSVDMVFCDLPYGVTACAWDTPIDLAALWREMLRVGRRNAAFVFTATFEFACTLRAAQPLMNCCDLVWAKRRPSGHLNARRRPLRAHEFCLVFSASQPTYNPLKRSGDRYNVTTRLNSSEVYGVHGGTLTPRVSSERYPTSILGVDESDLRHDSLNGNRQRAVHPTQKPVALLEWLIRTYSHAGDTVLDPTAGSGTTAVAAIRTGRQFVCIEKDATYFDTMKRRVAEAEAQAPLPGMAPWEQHGRDTAAATAAG